MKKIVEFFVMVYTWFLSLFMTEKVVKKSKPVKESRGDSAGQVKWTQKAIIPIHNNRKRTRGRHIQVIEESNRVIFHAAK